MNKLELKAKHPELFAEVIAEGEAKERDRATAHVTLGRKSGEMAFAIDSVLDGSPLTAEVIGRHMDSATRRLEQRAYQLDSDAAGAVLAGAAANVGDGGKDLGDQVADLLCAQRGKKPAVSL